jgi:hypothetical protein
MLDGQEVASFPMLGVEPGAGVRVAGVDAGCCAVEDPLVDVEAPVADAGLPEASGDPVLAVPAEPGALDPAAAGDAAAMPCPVATPDTGPLDPEPAVRQAVEDVEPCAAVDSAAELDDPDDVAGPEPVPAGVAPAEPVVDPSGAAAAIP